MASTLSLQATSYSPTGFLKQSVFADGNGTGDSTCTSLAYVAGYAANVCFQTDNYAFTFRLSSGECTYLPSLFSRPFFILYSACSLYQQPTALMVLFSISMTASATSIWAPVPLNTSRTHALNLPLLTASSLVHMRNSSAPPLLLLS